MRIALSVLTIALAGCSLDFIADPDEPDPSGQPTDPDPPVTRCALGPRYHMPSSDCGPLPPGTPPGECWSTITVEPDWIDYCWSDVCEGLTYDCRGDMVTARSEGGQVFTGDVLPSGNLYWDAYGYAAEFTPY